MKNQPLLLASVLAGGLSLLATGCLLGSDPDKNSQVIGAPPSLLLRHAPG